MFYIKLSAVSEQVFEEFGLGKVKTGWIPDENDFIDKVKAVYKKRSKQDDWSPTQFTQDVKAIHEDLRRRVLQETGQTGGKLTSQVEALKRRVQVLEAYVAENKRVIGLLQTDPKQVAELLKKEKGKSKIETKFYSDKQTVHIDRLQGLDGYIAILEGGRPADAKGQGDYNKAVNFAHRVVQDNITAATAQLEKYNSMASTLQNRIKSLGKVPTTKEITVKPSTPNPFIDLHGPEGLLKILEGMEPETRTEEGPHPYKWLMNFKAMQAILDRLMAVKPEKDDQPPLKYKSDILVVQQQIKELIGRLWTINHAALREVPDILATLNEEQHILSSLSKQDVDWYKGLLAQMKAKHGPQTFEDLVRWSEKSGEFEKADTDLPAGTEKDRELLHNFLAVVKDIRVKNTQLQKNWDPIKTQLNKLKVTLAEVRALFNKVSKEDYFRQWMRGDVPAEMKPPKPEAEPVKMAYDIIAAKVHVDPVEGFAGIKEQILGFKNFLEEHKMFGAAYKHRELPGGKKVRNPVPESEGKQLVHETMQGGQIGKYIEDLGSYITKILGQIDSYADKVDGYLRSIMMGKMDGDGKDKTDGGRKEASDCLRRMAAFLEAMDDLGIVLAADVVPFRSEYPVTVPLMSVSEKPGTKRFKDYFEKSFPVEKILNEWFKQSGGETLKADKFPAVIDAIIVHFKAEIEGKFDKDKMQQELDKAEDRLSKVLEEKRHVFEVMDKADAFAQGASKEIDRRIEEVGVLSEVDKKKIKELDEKRRRLEDEYYRIVAESTHVQKSAEVKHEIKEWEPIKGPDKPQTFVLPQPKEKGVGLYEPVGLPKKPEIPKQQFPLIHIDKEKIQKIADELDTTMADLREAVATAGKGSESVAKLEEYINEIRHSWAGLGVKQYNKLGGLQDEEAKLNRDISRYQMYVEQGAHARDLVYSKNALILAVWNTIDGAWMRKIRAFQTTYNLNFDDYVNIHSQVEKILGHTVKARAYDRLEADMKKQVQDLRKRGEPVPAGVSVQLHNIHHPEDPKQIPKRANEDFADNEVLFNMEQRVASRFLGPEITEDIELVLA